MNIILIGTGNTAMVLGRKLKQAGHDIGEVYGRNLLEAEKLARMLEAKAVEKLNELSTEADIYVLAVSDDALAPFAAAWKMPHGMVVHTAGSISKEVLKNTTTHYGVLYPLQSLRKQMQHLPEIPICVDASDEATLRQVKQLAESISSQVFEAGDTERLKLHLAAVFVNNFVNHIYYLMQTYCEKEGLDFSLLHPLIQETANRIADMPPRQAQTGPALRHDKVTLVRHLLLLQSHPFLKDLYRMFTENIQQQHGENGG